MITRKQNSNRPLVTLAVFAFNQEVYIRETIKGVLSQTYQPLEIILSDDHSSDRTFQIMQEMAAAYIGPHRVICRQNPENIGTYNHLIAVVEEAKGEFFIVNAGDDISYSNRAEVLLDAWLMSGATALSSGYDEIDDKGRILRSRLVFPPSPATQFVFGSSRIARKHNGFVLSPPGFSSAYDTDFLKKFTYCPGKLLIEDGTIGGVINCLGLLIHQIDEPLIRYRIHSESITIRDSGVDTDAIRIRERKISNVSISTKLMIEQIFAETRNRGVQIELSVEKKLKKGIKYAENTYEFWGKSPIARVATLANTRSTDDFKFVLVRILGFSVFQALKRIQKVISHFGKYLNR